MTIETDQLIVELLQLTYQNIEDVEAMLQKPIDQLNWRPAPKSWNTLECIAHLNRYHDFYIPEIKKSINKNWPPENSKFYPGLIGNLFVNMIRTKRNIRKMKTLKRMDPLGSMLSKQVLRQFIFDQNQLITLLQEAKKVNLNKSKTAISISKQIKMKLGDTLRFVVYHNERHVFQALKTLDLHNKKAA